MSCQQLQPFEILSLFWHSKLKHHPGVVSRSSGVVSLGEYKNKSVRAFTIPSKTQLLNWSKRHLFLHTHTCTHLRIAWVGPHQYEGSFQWCGNWSCCLDGTQHVDQHRLWHSLSCSGLCRSKTILTSLTLQHRQKKLCSTGRRAKLSISCKLT